MATVVATIVLDSTEYEQQLRTYTNVTQVKLFGRSRLSLTRTAIMPDVVGRRIKLIRTNNPYTYLKPGDRGTVVDVTELPSEDTSFSVLVQWDNGSRLTILDGYDDYRMVYDE